MARIRTVKPEFFTSDDICTLSMAARLLYIGVWCEADREGRMEWKPRSLKRRYLPDDAIDIEDVCAELIDAGLVVLYGDSLAYIPTFAKHQHVNPREAASTLPDPETARVVHASPTRQHASVTVGAQCDHAQVGREGKGKEGKEKEHAPADADATPADPKPKKPKRAEITLTAFAEQCREAGEAVIPEDDAVFAYAEKVGLPAEYVGLAWTWFKAKYTDGAGKAKRYANWRQTFQNAVRDCWPKFWAIGQGGEFYLTTAGKQAQLEAQS